LFFGIWFLFGFWHLEFGIYSGGVLALESLVSLECAPVAQLDRAFPSEGKGRWFEPSQAHHEFGMRLEELVSDRVHRRQSKNCISDLRFRISDTWSASILTSEISNLRCGLPQADSPALLDSLAPTPVDFLFYNFVLSV
jgi:hypothetical protein